MPSLALLVSQVVQFALQPGVLGPIAVALALGREIGPDWKPSTVRLAYDFVLLMLGLVLVVLLALDLSGSPGI